MPQIPDGVQMSYWPVNPAHWFCVCGQMRCVFRNSDGLRILRCPNCETEDILAYLRLEYGPGTSVQFLKNTKSAELKTCPTCGASVTVLIPNVQNQQRFCHHCSGVICPTFLPHVVFTEDDVKLLRTMGVDPEVRNIDDYVRKIGAADGSAG